MDAYWNYRQFAPRIGTDAHPAERELAINAIARMSGLTPLNMNAGALYLGFVAGGVATVGAT